MASDGVDDARNSIQKNLDRLRSRGIDVSKIHRDFKERLDAAIPLIREGQRVADQDLESWGLPRVGGDIDKL